jgi:hypothetical protein
MATPNDDHVEGFGGCSRDAHAFIIRCWRSVGLV